MREDQIIDPIKNGDINMAINTSDNKVSKNGAKLIRHKVLAERIPYFSSITTVEVA